MPKAADGVAGRQDRVDAVGERAFEVALDQGADLLRAHVIGVVVAGREHVGADHQPPAHFGAEAAGAGLLVEVDDVGGRLAQAVAHAVVAREIARGLGRRDYIISGQRMARVGQADVDDASRRRRAATRRPRAQSASISVFMPSRRYSFGTPIVRPFTERPTAAS